MNLDRNILIWLLVFVFSCELASGQQVYSDSTFQKIKTENKSVRAQRKFKFANKRFRKRIDFTRIDTNAVYIFTYQFNSNGSVTHYRYYRFFKGAVFESGPYLAMPDSIAFENLTYGTWRCYTMDRHGLLVIETPKRSEMDSRWIYYYGTIKEDRIELMYYRKSYFGFGSSPTQLQPSWLFIKQKASFKNRTYKWD